MPRACLMRAAARVLLLTTVLGLGACGESSPVSPGASALRSQQAQCFLKSEYLQVGEGLDAPGRLEVAVPAVTPASGPCRNNRGFQYGSGLYDITGVVANTSGMGWESPTQVFSGLQQRQYARAFAIASPCNGKRVMFVDTDTGMIFGAVRLKVLALIAADPQLSSFYGPDNLMLSATHTHEGPAGYSHYLAFNLFHFGYDDDTFQTIAQGIYQAIRLAQANLLSHPQSGHIKLAVGELLNTNINRSLPAFALNSEAERRQFLNQRGEIIDTNKRMVQLSFVRDDGSPVGLINWFGVHPTIIGENLKLVSSDMKGYAGLGFERLMGTDYNANPGPDNFVAAFSQADEGDSSPNLFIRERPYPDPTRGGGKDEYESAAISGTKHIAKALQLFERGRALSGPIDYRLFFVKMDAVTVDDPVVLASLQHPAELDAPVKRTCSPVLGPSFAAGAEDGPGPATEGLSCASSPELLAAALGDFQTLLNFNADNPTGHILPLQLVSQAALCDLSKLPPVAGEDFSCQAEKPIALPVGPPASAEPVILPMQIFRLGNLALVGIPWEVTTMSARRIRQQLLDVLAPAGIDTVVVAGLVNDYVHYLPTREEYASQQYEGASDIFGPWTLAAVQQELRKLAISLRDGSAAPAGPDYVDGIPVLIRPPYVPSDVAGVGKDFGTLLRDVPEQVQQGDTVSAEFQAGHPRNDLKTQSSYVYVEQQQPDGSWKPVLRDQSPELWFVWKPTLPSPLPIDPAVIGTSTAEVVWHIPANQPAGTYRLRHDGTAQTLLLPRQAYSGVSGAFTLGAPASACP